MKSTLVLPFLVVVATACGGAVQSNAVQRNQAAAQCSLQLAPHANADAIQRALQSVADGAIDPCSGALAHRELYSADLSSIEETPDGYVVLVFWMRLLHPGEQPTQRP